MNRCPEHPEWVLYAADELPAARRRDLQDHLDGCESCRRELAAVARGLGSLAALDCTPPMRAEATEALRRRLAEEAARKAARPWILTFVRRYRWASAAAILFWVVLIAALLAPAHRPPHKWITDVQVTEEIAEITAGVEMLEFADYARAYDAGANHKAPAAEKIDDEIDRSLRELADELGVEG